MKSFKYIPLVFTAGFLLIITLPRTAYTQAIDSEEVIRTARQTGVEPSLLDEFTSRAESHGISEQALLTVIRSATELAGNNLPYEMIFKKAFEGLAKGVPSSRIETAITNIRQNILNAAEMVDPWIEENGNLPFNPASDQSFRTGLIIALSNVMRNDVSAAAAGEILTALSSTSLPSGIGPAEITAAVTILPRMTEYSNRPGTASTFIIRALKSGFNAEELQNLPSAMQIAHARNQLPVTTILETVSGQFQGLPTYQVLQNLINGNIPAGPPGVGPVGLDNPSGRFTRGGL